MRLVALPGSSSSCEQHEWGLHDEDYYATALCFNVALCYHLLLSLEDGGGVTTTNGDARCTKVRSLYAMALEAMNCSSSRPGDSVLQTIVFNNIGQLHFQQGTTLEGVACFQMVRNLLASAALSSFDSISDFQGMALNTLMDCNASPAA